MPSGVVGVLRINLVANSASFSAEMKKARDSIKGFAEDSKSDLRKFQSDAAKLFKDTRTDAERYAASMERLKALHARGLDDSTFARAGAKLRAEFSSQVPLMDRWSDKLRGMFSKQGTEDLPLLKAIAANAPHLAATGAIAVGFAGIAVAAATAAAAIAITKQRWEELVHIGRTSAMLGADPQKLLGLQHAAVMSDIAPEELGGAMAKMQRKIAEGAGGGEAALPFNAMKLNIKELLQMDAAEAFIKIAGGMKALGTDAERSAVAIQIFGRSGYMLKPMLKEGEEGLRKFMAEAQRMGLIPSKHGLEGIEEAHKAMLKASEAAKGAGTGFAAYMVPTIRALGEGAEWSASMVKKLFDAMTTKAPTSGTMEEIESARKRLMLFEGLALGPIGVARAYQQSKDWGRDTPNLTLSDEAKARVERSKKGMTGGGAPEPRGSVATAEMTTAFNDDLDKQRGILANMQQFWTTDTALAAKLREAMAVDPSGEKARQWKKIADETKETIKQIESGSKIKEMMEKIRAENATTENGQGPAELALREQWKNQGPPRDVSGLRDRMADLQQVIRKDLGGALEATLDPMEKYNKEIDKIRKAFEAGVFGDKGSDSARRRLEIASQQAAAKMNPWAEQAKMPVIDKFGLSDKEVQRAHQIEEIIQRWGANSPIVAFWRRSNKDLTQQEARQRASDTGADLRERLNPDLEFKRRIADIDLALAMKKLTPEEAATGREEARKQAMGRKSALLEDMFPTYQPPQAALRGSQQAYNAILSATTQANDPKLELMKGFDQKLTDLVTNTAKQFNIEPAGPPL